MDDSNSSIWFLCSLWIPKLVQADTTARAHFSKNKSTYVLSFVKKPFGFPLEFSDGLQCPTYFTILLPSPCSVVHDFQLLECSIWSLFCWGYSFLLEYSPQSTLFCPNSSPTLYLHSMNSSILLSFSSLFCPLALCLYWVMSYI